MSVHPHILSVLLLSEEISWKDEQGHRWVVVFPIKRGKLKRTGTAAPSFAFNPPPVGFIHYTMTSCSFRELGLREIYGTGVSPCCQAFLTDSLITCFVWASKEDPSEVHFSLLFPLELDLLLQAGLLQSGLG